MYSYYGVCPDGRESLILFEAVKRGIIPTVSDRLTEEERKEITSGAIYIWDERKSPMRRWTDGRAWSNSRVVGDFLEYRESVPDPVGKAGKYCIKPYGLRKRTIFLPEHGDSSLRLIAYFTSSDVKRGILKPPSADPMFAEIVKEMDESPSSHKSLQLLASMRKRKRLKSCAADSKFENPVSGRSVVAIAPAPSRGQVLEPSDNHLHTTHYSELETSKVLQPVSDVCPLNAIYLMPSHHAATRISDLRIKSESQDQLSLHLPTQLPSPVWRPHNMHSEDRRALSLLDAHNKGMLDKKKKIND